MRVGTVFTPLRRQTLFANDCGAVCREPYGRRDTANTTHAPHAGLRATQSAVPTTPSSVRLPDGGAIGMSIPFSGAAGEAAGQMGHTQSAQQVCAHHYQACNLG